MKAQVDSGSLARNALVQSNDLDIRLYKFIERLFIEQKETIELYESSIATRNVESAEADGSEEHDLEEEGGEAESGSEEEIMLEEPAPKEVVPEEPSADSVEPDPIESDSVDPEPIGSEESDSAQKWKWKWLWSRS
jgi:hypothetical protein